MNLARRESIEGKECDSEKEIIFLLVLKNQDLESLTREEKEEEERNKLNLN